MYVPLMLSPLQGRNGKLVMAMDFSENYTSRYGREIQSYHWNHKHYPKMQYYAVSRFESEAIEHVRNKDVNVNYVHEWNGGCDFQHKGRHRFGVKTVQGNDKHRR